MTPFAAPENGEEPVPIVSVGSDGMPPRCSRCRGYINPSSAFSVADNGNTWSCNMCGMVNLTPAWYYCSLGTISSHLSYSVLATVQILPLPYLSRPLLITTI